MTNPKSSAWYDVDGVGQLGADVAVQEVTFDAGAGSGAVGAIALFTVTGAVAFNLTAICTTILATEAGATISVGTPGAVAGIIAVTTGVDIDEGDIWFAAAPATVLDTMANALLEFVIGDGANIQANVLVDAINSGVIEFRCFWTPLTDGASVVAA
jgi:hypothetical protein